MKAYNNAKHWLCVSSICMRWVKKEKTTNLLSFPLLNDDVLQAVKDRVDPAATAIVGTKGRGTRQAPFIYR